MRKNEIIWVSILVILAGVYVKYFSHWGEKPQMAINASLRPNRRTRPVTMMIAFTLNDAYKIKDIKVVPLADGKVNTAALPVWDLSSDSNSVPTRAFRYGQPIHGMKPALKGVHAEPLAPGTAYRLTVSTGNITGSTDFRMPAEMQ
jgi:hypothetical protein